MGLRTRPLRLSLYAAWSAVGGASLHGRGRAERSPATSHYEVVDGSLREFASGGDDGAAVGGTSAVGDARGARPDRQKAAWDFIDAFDGYKTSRLYEM